MKSCFRPGRDRWLAAAVAFNAIILSPSARSDDGTVVTLGACRLETIGSAVVSAIEDGRTLALADGHVVRLAGIEVAAPADIAALARNALEELVGTTVMLRRAGPLTDRYRRLTAQVFLAGPGPGRWLQSDLVARGQARVAARIGDRACAAELWSREQAARDAKLGLWGDPYYVIQRAEDSGAMAAGDGRFAIVEGKVLSVRESGGTIYMNFGRRWTEDFTTIVAKRNEHSFAGTGIEPRKLEGRRVRIRGWMEVRGGPAVEATRPEQIEILEKR